MEGTVPLSAIGSGHREAKPAPFPHTKDVGDFQMPIMCFRLYLRRLVYVDLLLPQDPIPFTLIQTGITSP